MAPNESRNHSNHIQLTSFDFSNNAKAFDATSNPFDSSLPSTRNTISSLVQHNQRKRGFTIPWRKLEDGVWIVLPLIFHIGAILFLGIALFANGLSFLAVYQTSGTGRIDFGILGKFSCDPSSAFVNISRFFFVGSCGILPNTTTQICTPQLLKADYVSTLELLATSVPGFGLLTLPFYSDQTTVIFFSAFVAISTSFIIFLFPWSLAYFPNTSYPRWFKNLVRKNAKIFYQIAGFLAFISFLFTLTIGIGSRMLLSGSVLDFNGAISSVALEGAITGGLTMWEAKIGKGFNLVWAAAVFQALTTLGMNIALHNRIHLVIESGGEQKDFHDHY